MPDYVPIQDLTLVGSIDDDDYIPLSDGQSAYAVKGQTLKGYAASEAAAAAADADLSKTAAQNAAGAAAAAQAAAESAAQSAAAAAVTDTTLTVSGKPADSKVVGDKFAEVGSEINRSIKLLGSDEFTLDDLTENTTGITYTIDYNDNSATIVNGSSSSYAGVHTAATWVADNLEVGKVYRMHIKAEVLSGTPVIIAAVRGVQGNVDAAAVSVNVLEQLDSEGYFDFKVDSYMKRISIFMSYGISTRNSSAKISEVWIREYDTSGADTDARQAIDALDVVVYQDYESGNITNAGNTSDTNSRIRSASSVQVKPGMYWLVDDAYKISIAFYNNNRILMSSFDRWLQNGHGFFNGRITIPESYVGKWMAIRILKVGYESSDISADVSVISDHIRLHNTSNVLTTKNNIKTERQFMPQRGASSFTWTFGKSIRSSGEISDSILGAVTEPIPCVPGETIENIGPATDEVENVPWNLFAAEYNGDVFIARRFVGAGGYIKLGDNTTKVRFSFAYTTSAPKTMNKSRLVRGFRVRFVGNIVPGDGQRPVYAAFGASTTVGAIHYYTGEDVTYTPYAFPDYIGQILGMTTYNLGKGTTGFMARNSGKSPNFMDQIYNNSAILDIADLVTIMFGYGNDRTAGLPFGSWDDYFPYDEVGAFYVDGEVDANQAGVATMLDAGATLMGCLNWCIKWIGDTHPKATLVCIYGAPSLNGNYPVTIIDNEAEGAGTAGVSPYKISINRDYTEDQVDILRKKLNIPILNLDKEALPFSYYSSVAMEEVDGNEMYAVFSTTGTPENPVWNSHPNDRGYLMYARYLAGRISQYFTH